MYPCVCLLTWSSDLYRDRAPFVFTSDMAYVINGGDKPSSRFHDFVDLCCEAYNLIRKHTHLFLNLLGLVGTHMFSLVSRTIKTTDR